MTDFLEDLVVITSKVSGGGGEFSYEYVTFFEGIYVYKLKLFGGQFLLRIMTTGHKYVTCFPNRTKMCRT